jgi:hypothetical protein
MQRVLSFLTWPLSLIKSFTCHHVWNMELRTHLENGVVLKQRCIYCDHKRAIWF